MTSLNSFPPLVSSISKPKGDFNIAGVGLRILMFHSPLPRWAMAFKRTAANTPSSPALFSHPLDKQENCPAIYLATHRGCWALAQVRDNESFKRQKPVSLSRSERCDRNGKGRLPKWSKVLLANERPSEPSGPDGIPSTSLWMPKHLDFYEATAPPTLQEAPPTLQLH